MLPRLTVVPRCSHALMAPMARTILTICLERLFVNRGTYSGQRQVVLAIHYIHSNRTKS